MISACRNHEASLKQVVKSTAVNPLPNYYQDPNVFEVNREKARTDFIPFENLIRARSKAHPNDPFYKNLNGFWKIKHFENPSKVPNGIYASNDLASWQEISVPSCLELKNYSQAIFKNGKLPFDSKYPSIPDQENAVSVYRRTIDIPFTWKDKEAYIIFEGVSSAFMVYVNGQFVGYSEDSRAVSEFYIGKYVTTGINEIAVVVYKYSDGTYLENHNMWHLHGIYRNVYMIGRPRVKINDFYTITSIANNKGTLELDIELENKSNQKISNQSISVTIQHDSIKEKYEQEIKYDIDTHQVSHRKIEIEVPNVLTWTDEKPQLYDLYMVHRDNQGKETEAIHYQIGFKEVNIKNNTLLLNGKPIKIRGTVIHEFHPVNGYTQDNVWMESDAEQMKNQSYNACRNAHYTMNPYWYQLCDKEGIYGLDEANINLEDWHDKIPADMIPMMKYRVNNMWQRNKNHANIICWSLGHHIEDKTILQELYDDLRTKEKNKPISAYISTEDWGDINFISTAKTNEKPSNNKANIYYTMHSNLGNSLGELDNTWKYVMNNNNAAGGFIADLSDQTFMMKIGNTNSIYWAYGGLFGSTKSDSSECARGIFFGNKIIKPVSSDAKYTICLFDAELLDPKNGTVKLNYHGNFVDSKSWNLFWIVEEDGNKIVESKLDNLIFKPGESKQIKIPLKKINYKPQSIYVLKLSYIELVKGAKLFKYLNRGEDQFILSYPSKSIDRNISALSLTETDSSININGNKLKLSISKSNGCIQSLNNGKLEFLKSSLKPYFWRAQTDIDKRTGFSYERLEWKTAFDHQSMSQCNILINTPNQIIIEAKSILKLTEDIPLSIKYVITDNGEVSIDANLNMADAQKTLDPFRFGFKAMTSPIFGKLIYFGRGPQENYSDRNHGGTINRFQIPIRDMYVQYVRPQEQGNRSSIFWCQFESFDGDKVNFSANQKNLLNIVGMPFDYDILDNQFKKASDVKIGQTNSFIICERMAGLGNGDLAPSKNYRLIEKNIPCRFTIRMD